VPELPPPDETAVRQALLRHDLVRHEMRLDEHGLAVVARARGGETVSLLRSAGGRVNIQPYEPALPAALSEDQQNWVRYAAAHEGLTPLDGYREADSATVIVLTGDHAGRAWRHCIDTDGVELWRRSADQAAVAALHRERLSPGSLARHDTPQPAGAEYELDTPEEAPPAASLLVLGQAIARVLTTAGDLHDADQERVATRLRTMLADCDSLGAAHSASRAIALLAELQAGGIGKSALERRLIKLQESIRQELALLQTLILQPAEVRLLNDLAPFGEAVAVRFPDCAEDIAEAARCLACRRPTAAVFHCMRVAEHGLRAIAAHAQIALPSSVAWGQVPSLLRSGCPPALAAALHGLARCWRAPGLAPAAKYTEAEAILLFQALGGFMREVAGQRGDVSRV